jgi:hypothetical protein
MGWPVGKALDEASKFGMGKYLPPSVSKSYYDAVKQFANDLEEDKGNALDAVSLTRQINEFGPQNPAVNDMTINGPINSTGPFGTDIEFSPLSRIASTIKRSYIRIYIKCNSSDLLKPNNVWWINKELAAKNTLDSSGKIFSANITSSSILEAFNKPITKSLIGNILSKDIDVAIIKNEKYLVIDPESLINIQEEDNDINDVVEVGMRDNSTDYTFAYPGSGSGVGGMPDGAAGIVQLPYSGPGQV